MSSQSIIVVENGRMYSGPLRNRGYTVITARDGDGALGILATEVPDLLVLDMATPQLDTVDMCKRARAILGTVVPIILLAPPDDPGTLHMALQSGASDYLLAVEKPDQIVERLEVLAFGPKEGPETEAEIDTRTIREHGRAMRATTAAEEVEDEEDIFEQRARRAAARGDRDRFAHAPAGRIRAHQPRRIVVAKVLAIVLGTMWLLGAGYHEFLRSDPLQNVRSMQLKRDVGNCRGTYNSRYKCKSSLLISSKNSLFGAWTIKIGVVFIPILVLSVLYHSILLRMWGAPRAR